MDYQACNSADEFEPRTTPKPAPKFDVSLIFDKPVQQKKLDNERVPISSPLKKQSYAEWREQNFSGKTFKPHSAYVGSHNVQCDETLNTQCFSQQPRSFEKERPDQVAKSNNLHYCTPKKKDSCQTHCDKIHNKNAHRTNDCSRNGTDVASTPPMCGKLQSSTVTSNSYTYAQSAQTPPQTKKHLISQKTSTQRAYYNGPNPVNEAVASNVNLSPNMMTNNDNGTQSVAPMKYPYPYPFYDMNSHAFPHFCPPGYANHSMENQETVKNLLQLVNSQSEQIKALQTQVDRLLKMQENTLRQSVKCVCAPHSPQQPEQYSVDASGSMNPCNYNAIPQMNKINENQNQYPIDTGKDNFCEKESANRYEPPLAEQQSKKAVVEQKVSIGVMTSFEFTVQNSPFSLDADEIDHRDAEQQKGVLSRMNLCNANEALRKGKNAFPRLPSGNLENIVEDSESYLSSSQQQSSNLNASSSTRDLQDKQQHADYQRDVHQRNKYKDIYEETEADQLVKQKYAEYLAEYDSNKRYPAQKVLYAFNNAERFEPNTTSDNAVPNTAVAGVNERMTMRNQKQVHVSKKQVPENILNTCDSSNTGEKRTGNMKASDCVDESLIISGGDLKVEQRPPTPEPSIHVEMQEYSSDDDSDKIKKTSKVGWTFYNNVLGQVNQLLQNTHEIESEPGDTNVNHNIGHDSAEGKAVLDTVKFTTLEQLRKLGISLTENNEVREANGKKVGFDTSYYPRLDYQANVPPSTSAISETNTSMHMKALALKYLNDEQLADLAIQKQGSASVKHVMLSNMQGTNMSFATMRYLERYHLLPGKGNAQQEGTGKVYGEMPPKLDASTANVEHTPALPRYPFVQTPRTSCPSKILDISTLKQQPKLL